MVGQPKASVNLDHLVILQLVIVLNICYILTLDVNQQSDWN
ncbi:hypothetical protein VS84_01574 [Vibrio cholerae]|nr:hypothetical protein VS84_01574 [Vibrio cholerae]